MADLDADVWVGGHGPVSDGSEIAVVKGYLQLVRHTAQAGIDADIPPLEASRELDLGEYAELGDSERLVGNMHRAYADLTDPGNLGKPIDLAAAVGDMRIFNGGPIVSHA